MVAAAPRGAALEKGAGDTMTSNRMPGLDFGLGKTADMTRSAVESVAQAS